MDFAESGLGGTPDEVQSTLRFSEDLLTELGSDLSRDEQLAIEALPSGSALLIVKRGANAGARFLLDQDVTSVGRHPNADIFLDDVTVSRRHAEFLRDGIQFTVRDLASLNGTYFDGQRIEQIVVSDGAEVQIGKFRLTFFASRLDLPQGA
ncbi:MAG: FHA domain-containing protein [Rhodoluna sp.]|jgi:pSer/pThr/pTyr-binding forkhead associated (FHA) protein|nr:FHA domain-containing protein [Rhodoluna sp.]MBP7818432.1 FHA domain-containing protein [Rhodoluna sp.]